MPANLQRHQARGSTHNKRQAWGGRGPNISATTFRLGDRSAHALRADDAAYRDATGRVASRLVRRPAFCDPARPVPAFPVASRATIAPACAGRLPLPLLWARARCSTPTPRAAVCRAVTGRVAVPRTTCGGRRRDSKRG